jgi:hypothetical protein
LLRDRTGQFRQALPDEQVRTFTIRVSSKASSYAGQLEIRGVKGDLAVRRVEARSCEQVANALALMAALAINPMALTDKASSTEDLGKEPNRPAPDRSPPTADAETPPARDEARPWHWSGGMLGRVVTRVRPDPSYGGAGFIDAEAPESWGPSVRLGATFDQNSAALADPAAASARFQWFGASLDGCPARLTGWDHRLALVPCLSLHLGVLRAEGRGISRPKRTAAFWADVGPSFAVRLAVSERISLEVQGAFIVPLTRPTFEITDLVSGTPAAASTVGTWGASLAGGLSYRFQ